MGFTVTFGCDFSFFAFFDNFDGDVQTFHERSQFCDCSLNRLSVCTHFWYHVASVFRLLNEMFSLGLPQGVLTTREKYSSLSALCSTPTHYPYKKPPGYYVPKH
jgi:hypothetical protein